MTTFSTSRFAIVTGAITASLLAVACARGLDDDVPPGDPLATEPPPPIEINSGAPANGNGDGDEGGGGGVGDGGANADGSVEGAAPTPDSGSDAGADAGAVVVTPPVVDGTIAANEYGAHVDAQNKQTSVAADPASTTWYMTWTATHLYVGVSAANVAEGVVLYIDHTASAGATASLAYDGTGGTLPFGADFAAYVKAGYDEVRTASAAGAWSAPTTGAITVKTLGAVREIAIPWSVVRAAGRPASFGWLGYATSPGGYVYGAMPVGVAAGSIGLGASFGSFFRIADATPGTGTKPFAVKQ